MSTFSEMQMMSNSVMNEVTGGYVVKPTTTHTHTVILLHGQGSTGQEFAEEFFECEIEATEGSGTLQTFRDTLPGVKWIFPSASPRYSSTFKEDITQWFNVHSLSNPDDRQELQFPGLFYSLQAIRNWIYQEIELVTPERLFLGGISQGAATALLAMITTNFTLGGFVGFSGWLPLGNLLMADSLSRYIEATIRVRALLMFEDWYDEEETCWSETPIFLGHERDDPVVMIEHGRRVLEFVTRMGMTPEWHEYESGQHWIQEPEEAQHIFHFLRQRMVE